LIAILNREANAINTLSAKIDLVASTGGAHSGEVTDYHDITAYLLVRKPENIRLIGQLPIVGTLFDMASNGQQFELNIPGRNRFYVGQNNVVPKQTKNPLERLRPQVILQALLINPIPPGSHVIAMHDDSDVRAEYSLVVESETPPDRADGVYIDHVRRKVTFSRYDLLPKEQLIYDTDGNVATRAQYSHFQTVSGVEIPWELDIERPAEEYSIHFTIMQITLNTQLADDKFTIQAPQGSQVVRVSETNPLPNTVVSTQKPAAGRVSAGVAN
jgi:hypothetical protein